MSNKNTQKKNNSNAGAQQRGAKKAAPPSKKDTSFEDMSEATRKKIENIRSVTSWQVPEDIFNLLKESKFDEAVTIEKILTGDAGHPGEEWQEVTRPRKKDATNTEESQPPTEKRVARDGNKQNRGRAGGSSRGGRANGHTGTKRGGSARQQGRRPDNRPDGRTENRPDNRAPPQEREPQHPTAQTNVSGAPTAQQIVQQYSPSPSTHSLPRGAVAVAQRPQSNNGQRPGPVRRDQVRAGSPKSQPHDQMHVHSQAAQGSSPVLQASPQSNVLSQSQEEHQPPMRSQEDSVAQQAQQTQPNQGQDRGVQPPRAAPGPKKAPGKGQFNQAGGLSSHTQPKGHLPQKGRRNENLVWQAKEAPSSGQATGRPQQSIPIRSSPEPQVARQASPVPSQNVTPSEDNGPQDKAAVILPSDLNAYDSDDTETSLNLHFGNFGLTPASAPKAETLDPRQRQTSSAVSRPPVARPVATPPPKETKTEAEPSTVTPSPQPTNSVSQPPPARKPAPRPQEKKQAPQATTQQPQQRPNVPTGITMDSGLSDEMAFQQAPHMQMNPAFSSYNPPFHFLPSGPGFGLSDIDPAANPSLPHHNMNFYDPQAFVQAPGYRASSPHQGDKYQGPYREPKYPQQPQSASPVQDRHEKHRQDNESPPPRTSHSQQVPQSPQSPPPGPHPSQPQPLPYSMPTSQYPQMYPSYPYQYSYPTSSQFTPGFSRGYPVHYAKPYPNLSTTTSGGYPLSPPTSSGYPDDVQMLAGDYNKTYMPPVMQSFFHTGVQDPSSGGAPSHMGIGGQPKTSHTPPTSATSAHGSSIPSAKSQQSYQVSQSADPYKDYSGADMRGTGAYYKGGYAPTQPSSHQPQYGGQQATSQYAQQGGQYQGNGQFQFMHHQPHPHSLMQGGQQSQQNSNLSAQGQPSFP